MANEGEEDLDDVRLVTSSASVTSCASISVTMRTVVDD